MRRGMCPNITIEMMKFMYYYAQLWHLVQFFNCINEPFKRFIDVLLQFRNS